MCALAGLIEMIFSKQENVISVRFQFTKTPTHVRIPVQSLWRKKKPTLEYHCIPAAYSHFIMVTVIVGLKYKDSKTCFKLEL